MESERRLHHVATELSEELENAQNELGYLHKKLDHKTELELKNSDIFKCFQSQLTQIFSQMQQKSTTIYTEQSNFIDTVKEQLKNFLIQEKKEWKAEQDRMMGKSQKMNAQCDILCEEYEQQQELFLERKTGEKSVILGFEKNANERVERFEKEMTEQLSYFKKEMEQQDLKVRLKCIFLR